MKPDRPAPLASKVATALDRLARARRIQRQAIATRQGVTPLQVELLTTLADGPPPPPLVGMLATEIGVAQPTITDSLRALERKGLVERHLDSDDARRTATRLTGAGRALVRDARAADADLVAAIGALPPGEQAVLLETLLGLIGRLVESGAITVARTCLTCRHHEYDGVTHHCTLLAADLAPAELRVNCPEHAAA